MGGVLYISCGVPGSGKTTFLNNHLAHGEIVISRDDIRFSLLKKGDEYFSRENEVFNIFVAQITHYINLGRTVYADATHLNYASRTKLTNALLNAGCDPSAVYAICFEIPLDICLERNEKRRGTKAYCPPEVIKHMYHIYETAEYEFEKAWKVDKNGKVFKLLK